MLAPPLFAFVPSWPLFRGPLYPIMFGQQKEEEGGRYGNGRLSSLTRHLSLFLACQDKEEGASLWWSLRTGISIH